MEEAGHDKAQHSEMEMDDTDSDDSGDYPEFESALRGIDYWFSKGMVFSSFEEFLQRKNAYSSSENVHLVVDNSHKLKTNYHGT